VSGRERRPRGVIAEPWRFRDSLTQVDAWTAGIFFVLLAVGGRHGIIAGTPGIIVGTVGARGMFVTLLIAVVRWRRGRNEPPPSAVSKDRLSS